MILRDLMKSFEKMMKIFEQSGLKVTSVIRAERLAVVSGDILLGAIGEIS